MEDTFFETFFETFLVVFVVVLFIFVVIVMVWFVISLLSGKIESKPFHIKLTSDKKITTNTPSEPEKCTNCGRVIGKLEKTCLFEDQAVCVECYQRLEKQGRIQ